MTDIEAEQFAKIERCLLNSKSQTIQAFLKAISADDWTVSLQEKLDFELYNLHSAISIKVFEILSDDATIEQRKSEMDELLEIVFDLGKISKYVDYFHDKSFSDYMKLSPEFPYVYLSDLDE